MSCALVLVSGMGVGGCGGAQGTPAEAALAESTRGQDELRELEERWAVLSREERGGLRPDLETFIGEHGTDPSVARARLLLGRLFLDQGKLAECEAALRPVLEGPVGRTRDEAGVVQAGVENRRGQSEQALSRLEPLEGKLLSEESRDLFARERVRAALATRRWPLASDTMIVWLSQTEHSKAETETGVRLALREFPAEGLTELLVQWETTPPRPSEKNAREWLQREVIERLQREALANHDTRLAKDLLAHAPTWLRASETGEQLALLAAQAEESARVVGRVVGVVLGGQTTSERQRNVQLVAGLLEGLGPNGAGGAGLIQLIVEEDRGSTATTLAALSSQGASLLIAGANDETAQAALQFAEARRVPVLTVTAPDTLPTGASYGFVFGAGAKQQAEVLREGLRAAGAQNLQSVGEGGVSCVDPLTRPGVGLFPVADWSRDKVDGLVVLADATCGARLVDETRAMALRPLIGVGLEASSSMGLGTKILRLSAGAFPTDTPGRSWFELLGLDLARLAQAALGDLPLAPVSDEKEVRARHDHVQTNLLRIEVPLQSTSARGFSGAHQLPRPLRVSWSDAKPGGPAAAGKP